MWNVFSWYINKQLFRWSCGGKGRKDKVVVPIFPFWYRDMSNILFLTPLNSFTVILTFRPISSCHNFSSSSDLLEFKPCKRCILLTGMWIGRWHPKHDHPKQISFVFQYIARYRNKIRLLTNLLPLAIIWSLRLLVRIWKWLLLWRLFLTHSFLCFFVFFLSDIWVLSSYIVQEQESLCGSVLILLVILLHFECWDHSWLLHITLIFIPVGAVKNVMILFY